MSPAFEHRAAILALEEGRWLKATGEVENHYGGNATIPAGTLILFDFGYEAGSTGFYGTADVGGRLFPCQITVEDFHLIEILDPGSETPAEEVSA